MKLEERTFGTPGLYQFQHLFSYNFCFGYIFLISIFTFYSLYMSSIHFINFHQFDGKALLIIYMLEGAIVNLYIIITIIRFTHHLSFHWLRAYS